MDIKEVKRKWGSKISLIGNLDLIRVLPYGSREEVIAHVRDLIETVGKDGGYIVASDRLAESPHPNRQYSGNP